MNEKDKRYEEILNFIAEHGIEDKDSLSQSGKTYKKSISQKRKDRETVIDLHGKREEDAEKIFRNAIINSKKAGVKKLLVIHGKGLHSDPLEGPVLKKLVDSMLSYEFKNIIREFYPAPYNKGGTGATIIILR